MWLQSFISSLSSAASKPFSMGPYSKAAVLMLGAGMFVLGVGSFFTGSANVIQAIKSRSLEPLTADMTSEAEAVDQADMIVDALSELVDQDAPTTINSEE